MELRPEADSAFESLLSAIVFQQLAGAAARTIHGRLVTALGGAPVAPESVLAANPETLRAAGLSANKLAAIVDLAAKFVDGTVPTHDLDGLSGRRDRGSPRDRPRRRSLDRRDVPPLPAAPARRLAGRRSRGAQRLGADSRHGGAPGAEDAARARRIAEPPPEHGSLVLLACGRTGADRPGGRPGAGTQGQSCGSTTTFPPEEGVISSSKTSGT